MGAEQSRHSSSSSNNKKYSQDEVDRILRIEKLRIEQNYKDEIARNAARQKVEGLLLKSKNQATSSAPSPSLETSSASTPSTYSSTQNERHLLVTKPTVTNPNPNANNVRSPTERSNVASNATNNNRTSPQTPGNVNTTIIDTEAQSNNKKYSQDEVDRILRIEKLRMEQFSNFKDEIARNAARHKVEGLLLQSKNQATSSAPSPSLETRKQSKTSNVSHGNISFHRSASTPSTYSSTQNELHLLVTKPTVTNPNPNANNVRSPTELSNVASNATNNNRTSPQTPGNVNTTIIDTEAQSNNKKYSQDEVDRILRIEKIRMEQNYKDEIARNAARQKVEGLLSQSKNQATSSAPSPSLETSSASTPSTYSSTQNERHLLVTKPTMTNPNPNANNVRSPTAFSWRSDSNVANVTNNNRTSPQTHGNVNSTIIDTEAQRVQKQNEQPKKTRVDADEDDELNCYTCKRKYTHNIYQCPRGHSSCHLCRANLAVCGVCGSPVGDMRNNPLEAYIAQRKIRCPNSQDGCCLIIKMADLEAHTRQCLFRELACPLGDIFGLCRWRGKLQQLSKHFDQTHPFHRTGNVDTEMTVSLNDTQIVHLVVVGTFHFLFHMRVSEQRRAAYIVVQLIGTKNSAAKWSYEVYVYNKSEPRRKYHYTDVCQSINTPLTQIIADENCATLSFDYIGTFMNNDRLNYKFYIKRDVESGSARHPVYGRARSRNRSWVRASPQNN